MAHDQVVNDVLAAALRASIPTSSCGCSTARRRSATRARCRCTGTASPSRAALDWAMSNGAGGRRRRRCARSSRASLPSYRGTGIARRAAAAHDAALRRARPRSHDRAGAADVEGALPADADRALRARGGARTGCHYDPWLRTHERIGGRDPRPAPRSMTVTGSREEWEEWTALQFPEDGDYVVPARSCRCASRTAAARTSSRTSG